MAFAIVTVVVFVVLAGFLAYSIWVVTAVKPVKKHPVFIQDPDACRAIIAGKTAPDGRINMLGEYAARALANSNIQNAFGISNAFTSSDKKYVQDFKSEAARLIKKPNWMDIAKVVQTRTIAWFEGAAGSHKTRIHLPSLVQALSLESGCMVLFWNEVESVNCPDEDLLQFAEAISPTWVASKTGDNYLIFVQNDVLQSCVVKLFPSIDCLNPEQNPLRLILPAFETLWRVVLRAVIEVGFRGQAEWRTILIKFAGNPTASQILWQGEGSKVSAKFIVQEALRLYPPTRRVHREYQFPDSPEHVSFAADIEACHLSTEIWGPDVMLFNPERWARVTSGQEKAFMPFGSQPFVCPAKADFGPRIIALLVGIILDELKGDWRLDSDDSEVRALLGSGSRLSNERDSLGSVHLVRRGEV
ncbi:hypothetical protein BBP40_004987 [Aspergillus hancockii]|nr:hypothetical protein BBP40_004987 [Aspergillus hancockii]